MLSRRGVRIKILQLLYRFDRDSYLDTKDAVKYYEKDVEAIYDMFLFNIYTLSEIVKLTLEDSKKRKKKHIVTEYDEAFSPKFYTNEFFQSIIQNSSLIREFEKRKFSEHHDEDFYSKVYKLYVKEDAFKAYIFDAEGDHIEQLLELYRYCRQSEYFNEKMTDYYAIWSGDKSMVIGAVKKLIKSLKTGSDDFYKTQFPDEVTVKEYGVKLLQIILKESDDLDKVIDPVLENWDASRLAIIDRILIRMALVEFLHFETIPTKVTLNEYVELSKTFSTPKSKEFVNGVLDKLLKKFIADKKIVKEGRGLID